MQGAFGGKVIEAITKFATQVDIFERDGHVKITCDCVYCGRSKRGLPHLGIIIKPEGNKITGGINCFRCGANKPLKMFLYDLHEVLSFYGIQKQDIDRNVVVVESDSASINIDLNHITKNEFIEQSKFYAWIQLKYENNQNELRRKIFFNLNSFLFIKHRLNLRTKLSLYEAFKLLRDVKARAYVGKDNKFVLSFDNKVRYIFDSIKPERIEFQDERDEALFGRKDFPFVFNEYTKLKNPPMGEMKYYLVSDTNCQVETYEVMNVYVAEGVFDALSIKYYKNLFNMEQVNKIEKNIYNLYVAMAHSKIDKFVSEYFLGVTKDSTNLPRGVKEVNFIMIPDLNMNVKKYVFNIFKFVQRYYHIIRSKSNILGMKVYYLDVFDAAGCYDQKKIKDVNDIVTNFNKRFLRDIGLVEVF